MNAIICKNVKKDFILNPGRSVWSMLFDPKHAQKFHALKSVSLEAPKGRFVGLLGRNGAGKSTLLRLLGGVYSPDGGVVIVNGDLSAMYELGITGNEFLTGRAFAIRWLDVFGGGSEDRASLINDILDFSELGDAFDREIRTYSAGMKARLFFAIATARSADVFIIDEVLSVGDEYFQNKCWRRLRQKLSGGVSGIIATHDWSAILKLCPSSYVIDKGSITASGPSPSMVRRYLGLEDSVFSSGARFEGIPSHITTRALEDFNFQFSFKVEIDAPMGVAASIETFRQGYGWEHLLHLEPVKLTATQGVHEAVLTFPNLPLTPGDYALNLSLLRADGSSPAEIFDSRSWTSGNEIKLEVLGEPVDAALRAPLTAEILGRHDA